MEGGRAVAAAVFGERNPCGKLTVSWPRHVGQAPLFYNYHPGWHADKYADMPAEPQYAFGYGLSYTTFAYSGLAVDNDTLRQGEAITVTVEVRNEGNAAGTEIAQLYINDCCSTITTPVKELKAFSRVDLEVGQSRRVELKVPFEALSLVDTDLRRVVEPGQFEIMVGGSSRDCDLLKTTVEVLG
jgi:beta-glucosidase